MTETPNDTYKQPDKGSQDWHQPLNNNFEELDTDVEIRDTESNRSQYTPKAGAKFFATDTGAVFIGDSSDWNRLASSGASPAFQTRQVSEVGAKVNLTLPGQNLPAGSTTRLAFNSTSYDELGDVVIADDKFELSKPGVYHAYVEISWDLSGGADFLEAEINPNEKARELQYSPGGQFPTTHMGAYFKLTGDPPSSNELYVTVRQENGNDSPINRAGGHLSVVHLG
jgi:hypothetical protein